MKLNLGCGTSKLEGFVNVDIDESLSPDVVLNFTDNIWPWDSNSIDEIVCYHTIEHIKKSDHVFLFQQCHRVLKPEGLLLLTYPEFWKCAQNWKDNYRGMKDFWEATIYGRQSSPHDYHVALMDSEQVCRHLVWTGFKITYRGHEPNEPYNAVIKAEKIVPYTYEMAVKETVFGDATSKFD